MLAQNFKSAAELNITEVELRSLVTVLGMLERGELMHGESPFCKKPRQSNEFNMAATLDNRCGTIGCIAGWAHEVSGGVAFPEIVKGDITDWLGRDNQPLLSVFGIGTMCGKLYDVTPAQAAASLRSYLAVA